MAFRPRALAARPCVFALACLSDPASSAPPSGLWWSFCPPSSGALNQGQYCHLEMGVGGCLGDLASRCDWVMREALLVTWGRGRIASHRGGEDDVANCCAGKHHQVLRLHLVS